MPGLEIAAGSGAGGALHNVLHQCGIHRLIEEAPDGAAILYGFGNIHLLGPCEGDFVAQLSLAVNVNLRKGFQN